LTYSPNGWTGAGPGAARRSSGAHPCPGPILIPR